jgi:hypothetical protein
VLVAAVAAVAPAVAECGVPPVAVAAVAAAVAECGVLVAAAAVAAGCVAAVRDMGGWPVESSLN